MKIVYVNLLFILLLITNVIFTYMKRLDIIAMLINIKYINQFCKNLLVMLMKFHLQTMAYL